jgi:hypothetical protein
MFTVIWLVLFTVGLPVRIWEACTDDLGSNVYFIAVVLFVISSYTSSIVAVVWVSVIKRKSFFKLIGNILEVDNKIRYTLQEETNMNTNVFFNIISEIMVLTVIQTALTVYDIYDVESEPFYMIVMQIIDKVPDICNALVLFQFINLVFIVKQRYSHLNKRLNNWINGTVSRPVVLNREIESCSQSHRTVDHVNITHVSVSSVGNVEGTLKQTDIHLLRQIYSELYDITCLISDIYSVPILFSLCWILTGVLCSLYDIVTEVKEPGLTEIAFAISYSVLFFQVTFFCHTATNEARSSSILVQKFLLEGNCRKDCVNPLKMFSLQLQVMTIEYTACGFFSLNLSLFASVVSVITSYIIIMVQMH